MPLYFFPRDRQFWLYHWSAVAAGLTVTIGVALVWGFMIGFQISTSVAWVPLYSITVLGFRWLYKRFHGEVAPMGKLIAGAVLYSAAMGVVMTIILHATILPLFFHVIEEKYKALNVPIIYSEILFNGIRAEVPGNQLFILVWSFMYISVTASRRVRQAETHNLRLQNNLKEAQLSSLSNQLNPHFLFNSLNNIRFMIHEDARRADSMITSFSEILRYSLESSRHEKVSLGRELSIIGQYIAIVKTQFEERLSFSMKVDPSLHEAMLPPMVLQMLIENAVKHGLEHLQAGGKLTLEAAQEGQSLVFDVCNDTPATVASQSPGMGIGLRNIAQRLELLYGSRASLDATQDEGRFRVTLSLPMERAA
jgi:LytS/YehU family sensor histidine kinase